MGSPFFDSLTGGSFMKKVFQVGVPGTYGDKVVLLTVLESDVSSPWVVTLFHGVHGSASLMEGNKYSTLAHMLVNLGITVCMVESSRIRRDKYNFERRDLWAMAAFKGKSYEEDFEDHCRAIKKVKYLFPDRRHCLWGFSLGGLHALMSPIKVDGLVVSGSGDSLRDGNENFLGMPILDSVPSQDELYKACENYSAEWVHFFYGTEDDTFEEEACRRLFNRIPLSKEDKKFHIIEGADHSFRRINGIASVEPLHKMVDIVRPYL